MSLHAGIWVAAGGALGAVARYGVSAGLTRILGAGFPWGTFAVNVMGTLILGLLGSWRESAAMPPGIWHGLVTGLLGAFTTFSALQWETLAYLREAHWKGALVYLGASLVCGLVAVWLGYVAGHVWFGRFSTGAGGS